MAKTYGVGIIGTGVIFDDHAKAYGRIKSRARLVAVSDIDPIKLRKATDKYFVPQSFEDYHQMLERDDIDIIDVCTPPFLHEQMIIDALQTGKHVICEKPLAHTLESADRIIAEADKHPQQKLAIVYQLRYLPEVRRTILLRDEGLLGELQFGNFSRYSKTPGYEWWGRWASAGGGAVMTQYIHELDMMCHIFGKPVSVSATMDTRKLPIESEDCFAGQVQFESGAMVNCVCTVSAPHFMGVGFDVFGDTCSTHLPWKVGGLDPVCKQRAERAVGEKIPLAPAPSNGSIKKRIAKMVLGKVSSRFRDKPQTPAHVHVFKDFLDAIDNNKPVAIDAREARLSLDLCIGIYTSAMTGEKVSLPLDSTSPYYKGITTHDYDGRTRHQAG